MTRHPRMTPPASLAALGVALTCIAAGAAPAPAPEWECSRALVAELRRAGRVEAVLRWDIPGPDGAAVEQRGTLALEPPAYARLDVPGTGERVTLRDDGGEWLQPGLRQMVRLSPRQTGAAMRWWRLLASGHAPAGGEWVRERRLASGRYRLVVGDQGGGSDSAEVTLDTRGLPARLVLGVGQEAQAYRVSGWRSSRARGASGFRLSAPSGYEVVELP